MNEHDNNFVMTQKTMEAFLESQKSKGASANMLRRYKATVNSLYGFLPTDKLLTRESLLAWRADMNEKGYAHQTVQNYAKWVNLYLDFVGLSKIRFNRGKSKNISGMQFGLITAIEPTDKRDRKDVVWLCRCKCGTTLELPATRLILRNTLSCGCLQKESIKRINKYFDGTSLEKSLKDPVTSTRSMSGYVGVTRKRDKWQAYITYKRKRISLGTYTRLEDAIKARADGKEAVMKDAAELLKIYEDIHKNDDALPNKATELKRAFAYEPEGIKARPAAIIKRIDNTDGYTGISFHKNRWEARICYNRTRYMLGRFETPQEAMDARKKAEELLKKSPLDFVERYSKICKQYTI